MAHAATRSEGTSPSARYQRLAERRGQQRAKIAVAHGILVRAFHLPSRHGPDPERGAPTLIASALTISATGSHGD
jgi:hypothetical protein